MSIRNLPKHLIGHLTEHEKELLVELSNALEYIDNAIALRELHSIQNMKDLDVLRSEIHGLTCRMTRQ